MRLSRGMRPGYRMRRSRSSQTLNRRPAMSPGRWHSHSCIEEPDAGAGLAQPDAAT
jgi:hypothetical protein